jgi:DNA-3-methyladenine glycosylase
MSNDLSFLDTDAATAAKLLLGCILERNIEDKILRVRIVETEAYDQNDLASHSYRTQTERTKVMFGNAGHLYVYFTYGMHYCCNVVVGPEGHGAAVLFRAAEPLSGEELMSLNRSGRSGIELTNGPAKLCQALLINRSLNGHDLSTEPLRLIAQPPLTDNSITSSPRVGISKAKDIKWRFFTDSPYVSKP